MNNLNWSSAVNNLTSKGQAYVLVTLIGVSGSTPRNSGTKMVISHQEIFDTIGGGHLEHKAIKFAQQLLQSAQDCQHIEHFQLGSNLGQCCGGNASVLFECFASNNVNIMLFGAGHVGQALVPILASLPCQVTWVDSRAQQFPENMNDYYNVTKVVSDTPQDEISQMPANSYYIVMTHNHQLDFDISQAILKRADFHYFGLIASQTKWRRFQQRFKHREIDIEQVQRMSCPIGLAEVPGKMPMEVAVSIAGEIISLYQKTQQEQPKSIKHAVPVSQQGVSWQALKTMVTEHSSS
ncbi:xanthine dehydrogenase accessory protein XdhC [Colwelliaceae bacterium 6471]